MKKTFKILAGVVGLLVIVAGCVALVQAIFAFSDIRGWFANGGSEVIGDTHPVKVSARFWASFMCLFPFFLILIGSLFCRLGFRKGQT